MDDEFTSLFPRILVVHGDKEFIWSDPPPGVHRDRESHCKDPFLSFDFGSCTLCCGLIHQESSRCFLREGVSVPFFAIDYNIVHQKGCSKDIGRYVKGLFSLVKFACV